MRIRDFRSHWHSVAAAILFALGCQGISLTGWAQASPGKAALVPSAWATPKSVFDSTSRRNPFARNTAVVPPPSSATCLRYQGCSGPDDRRLATINDRTFAVGETCEIRCGVARYTVRCRSIERDYVEVEVSGEGQPRGIPFVGQR